jgi:uncharacterized RDD family membrane protein YckC
MKPKFELDGDDRARPSERLIDPDAFDASEQQFAAGLEQIQEPANASFVLDTNEEDEEQAAALRDLGITESPITDENQMQDLSPAAIEAEASAPEPDAWRNEVAARVNKYRSRKPREPRYPSLQLKFEPYEPFPSSRPASIEASAASLPGRQAISLDSVLPAEEINSPEPIEQAGPQVPSPETTARILEFPRSSSNWMPPVPLDELAGPVFDRPRILDVPDVEPPPPALGGILIERVDEPVAERRPGFEVPLRSARMARRLAGVALDALIVLAAVGVFSSLFFWITASIPPLRAAAGMIVAVAGIFWVAYQYLLLVYTGITPGLKLAKLRLSQFDGGPVPRKVRRWRVLASVLSGLSLGLGYAWCFLDEDELCWHDRITRTYIAPIK